MSALAIATSTALAEPTAPRTAAEIADRFFAFLECAPKTAATYGRAVRQFLSAMAGKGITAPTRADILQWKADLAAEGKAPATIQLYTIAVRQLFAFAATEYGLPNPAEHIKGAKVSKAHRKDCLSAEGVRAVLARIDRSTADGRRLYALCALMIACGLRDIEVYRANIEDLRTLADGTAALYVQGKGRTDKAEFVKVPAAAEKAVREYLADRPAAGPEDPLFCACGNRSKGRLSVRSISGLVKGAMIAAGYNSPRLTSHSLRHTAVTLSLLGGRTLQETQQFARHTNIATTQIYAHNLDAAANGCGETIAAAVFGN